MAKYRKRAVVVEASRWFAEGDHPKVKKPKPLGKDAIKVCKQCDHLLMDHGICETSPLSSKGYNLVCPGDWIITEGKLYFPLKPDIFEKLYVQV